METKRPPPPTAIAVMASLLSPQISSKAKSPSSIRRAWTIEEGGPPADDGEADRNTKSGLSLATYPKLKRGELDTPRSTGSRGSPTSISNR